MYSVWTHFKKCLQRQENFDRKIWLFHNENETYLIAGRKSTESQQGNWIILMHRLFVAGKILRKYIFLESGWGNHFFSHALTLSFCIFDNVVSITLREF